MKFVPWATPYDEDEILGLLKDYYKALKRLGHFQDGWSAIVYAPSPDGHVLDFSQLQDGTRIDERVLSLMRRMPFCSQFDQCVTQGQRSVNYTDPAILAMSRDIDRRYCGDIDRPLDTKNARPTDLILFDMLQNHEAIIILDVEENTIIEFREELDSDDFMKSNASEEEKLRYVSHYRNHTAYPAPTYLRELLNRLLRSLTVPNLQGSFVPTDEAGLPYKPAFARATRKLRMTLLEDYRWPGEDFREKDWHRDGAKLVSDAFDILFEEFNCH